MKLVIILLIFILVGLIIYQTIRKQELEHYIDNLSSEILQYRNNNMGSFLSVEKNEPIHPGLPNTIVEYDSTVQDNLFPKIKQTEIYSPSYKRMKRIFKQCMDSQQDTVKGCLTRSNVGLEPYLCNQLTSEYYGIISNYTGQLCKELMLQQRTSCANGPC
jgi:hypothetical protein